MSLRNFKKRIDSLDGGYEDPNEIVWYIIPAGEEPPTECDPAKHHIIWDKKEDASPAYGITLSELKEAMIGAMEQSRT